MPQPTDLLLQIEAAHLPEQSVSNARLVLSPCEHFSRIAAQDTIGERLLLRMNDRLTADYTATVTIARRLAVIESRAAVPPHMLPGETVPYLLDSRYCPADQFHSFVADEFAGLTGGALVAALSSFVHDRFHYVPGASNSDTTALETFVRREGVCRDFAHVLITLARAAAIPARMASVYAPTITPPDFHAVAEVFLAAEGEDGEGEWLLVDPTGMARADEMAKIGIGRDAADVAFLTSFAPITMTMQSVEVLRAG